MVFFLSFGRGIEGSHHSAARRGVRIPRPKIEELALQAQGVGIFAKDEYPSARPQFPANALQSPRFYVILIPERRWNDETKKYYQKYYS